MDSELAGVGTGVEERGQELEPERFLFPEWPPNQSDRRNLLRI